MYYVLYYLIIGVIHFTECAPSLRIIKKVDNNFIPVTSEVVEEFDGAKLSILCELVSSQGVNNEYIDNQVAWVKFGNHSKNEDNRTLSSEPLEPTPGNTINTAVKTFNPLQSSDAGSYICVSLKYMLFQRITLVVITNRPKDRRPSFPAEPYFCNVNMFRCVVNSLCIHQHYVCDGKQDCKDGSDESLETCKGDPCQAKLKCDDGRCIPTSWCCDRQLDLNCSVTIRPACCQQLSETYEDMDQNVTPNGKNIQHIDSRFLFISLCSLSIVFTMAIFLLVLTKFLIFARKSTYDRTEGRHETIGLYNQSNLLRSCRSYLPCNIYSYHMSNRTHDSGRVLTEPCDMSDPLFQPDFGERLYDQPPSYNDIVETDRCRLKSNDPPPPYSSAEQLQEV